MSLSRHTFVHKFNNILNMKDYIEHLIASSDELEKELEKDYNAGTGICPAIIKPEILCIGLGNGGKKAINSLKDENVQNTVFEHFGWNDRSVFWKKEMLDLLEENIPQDNACIYDSIPETERPLITVFILDINENIDIEKTGYFINEIRTGFPHTRIIVMVTNRTAKNDSRYITIRNILSPAIDCICVSYLEAESEELVNPNAVNTDMVKDFIKMTATSGNLNIDISSVIDFIEKSDTGCSEVCYYSSYGKNMKDAADAVINRYGKNIQRNKGLIYIEGANEDLCIDGINRICQYNILDNFLFGIKSVRQSVDKTIKICIFTKENQNIQ